MNCETCGLPEATRGTANGEKTHCFAKWHADDEDVIACLRRALDKRDGEINRLHARVAELKSQAELAAGTLARSEREIAKCNANTDALLSLLDDRRAENNVLRHGIIAEISDVRGNRAALVEEVRRLTEEAGRYHSALLTIADSIDKDADDITDAPHFALLVTERIAGGLVAGDRADALTGALAASESTIAAWRGCQPIPQANVTEMLAILDGTAPPAVDLATVSAPDLATPKGERCTAFCPPEMRGHWKDWHRGSGCSLDDGNPRTAAAVKEIAALGVDHPRPAARGKVAQPELTGYVYPDGPATGGKVAT